MLIHADPKTGLEGKFSLEFCAALALSQRSAVLKDFVDSKVRDPEIQKLIKKVSKAVTDEAGVRGTEVSVALMKVRLTDGTTYSCRVEHKKGSPGNPSSVDEIVRKFEECARLRYTGEQGHGILEVAMNLEKVGNIRELIALLSSPADLCD
jgi:2-methylcitrate dehydratase PrpD